MSRRGGKRRPVLQLGNSSSKLHRYGYSKEFHAKGHKGNATTLVGDYSDSDSENSNDTDEQGGIDVHAEQDSVETHVLAAGVDPSVILTQASDGVKQAKTADMDDELKNFLSEIDAIPIPAVLSGQEQMQSSETNDAVNDIVNRDAAEQERTTVPTSGKNLHRYSMFVKGESEFVHNTKEEVEVNEEADLDGEIPEEPTTNWQMVQDETTQYYYYWNTVTNEVTWEIPTEYTQFLLLHREYEEKMAKYTPQQLEAIRNKMLAAKIADGGDQSSLNGAIILSHDLTTQKHDANLSTSQTKEGKTEQSRVDEEPVAESRFRVVSPVPPLSASADTSAGSYHHKHKKEKKSHHKKKHKRRHDDSDVEESKFSPKMPELGPPFLSEAVDKTITPNQRLTSIVPYLSDQDDDSENENVNTMPELGPPALINSKVQIPVRDGTPEREPSMPELRPALTPVQVSPQNVSSQELVAADHSQDRLTVDSNLHVLSPSLPLLGDSDKEVTVEKEHQSIEEMSAMKKNMCREDTDAEPQSWEEGLNVQNDVVGNEESTTSSKNMVGSETQQLANSVESVVHIKKSESDSVQDMILVSSVDPKFSQPVRTTAPSREVIDMFAEDHFDSSISMTEAALSSGNTNKDKVTQESLEITKNKTVSSSQSKTVEDPMEEGEIPEISFKQVTELERKKEDTCHKNKLNIVGYGSDDEEEEGELKESPILVEEVRTSTKKKKKKDKRGDSKKQQKETRPDYSFMDSKLDESILSKMSETIDQTISKIVTQTVSKAVSGITGTGEKQVDTVDEDGDIDFEDLDDIDRALEVALEKKLEKKKVELAKSDEKEKKLDENNMTVTDQVPKLLASSLPQTAKAEDKVSAVVLTGAGGNEDSPAQCLKKNQEDEVEEKPKTSSEEEDRLQADLKEMADLALNKLEFLDISMENLSRLQVLLIELQTRYTDWKAGGLSSQYFFEQLKVAEGLLEQYELSAVPEGWACQWDRANNRYYYRSKVTNRIQWEYPQVEGGDKSSKPASSKDGSVAKAGDGGAEEQHKSSRSGGSSSRHRKREEKDRSKYDKRSSSHRYRRKRRRWRDHSASSNSSEGSQQHRHHHKSKKKKRHRSERSPSVQIVEDIDGVDIEEIQITETVTTSQHGSPAPSQPASDVPASHSVLSALVELTQNDLAAPPPPPLPLAEEDGTAVEGENQVGEDMESMEQVESNEEETKEVVGAAVIYKLPQIVVPSQLAAAKSVNPEFHSASDLHSAPAVATTATTLPVCDVLAAREPTQEVNENATEGEKHAKKKKKDKKLLATGSSIMMKKKHMSSMVQKWQNVKKEVEKEDRAKELRQAAIRKKIEELK